MQYVMVPTICYFIITGLWCLMPLSTMLLVKETEYLEKTSDLYKSLTNFITYCCIECIYAWAGFGWTRNAEFNWFHIQMSGSTKIETVNRNDPDLVQAFLKKWWVESDFKAPNLPLSLRYKVPGCHYNSI